MRILDSTAAACVAVIAMVAMMSVALTIRSRAAQNAVPATADEGTYVAYDVRLHTITHDGRKFVVAVNGLHGVAVTELK